MQALRLPLITLDASAVHYGETLFAATGDLELLPAGTSIPLPAISPPQQEFALPVSQNVRAGPIGGVLAIFDAGRIGAIQNIAPTSAQQGQIDLATCARTRKHCRQRVISDLRLPVKSGSGPVVIAWTGFPDGGGAARSTNTADSGYASR